MSKEETKNTVEAAKVVVDSKLLASVKRGLTDEVKKAKTLRTTYRNFGMVNAQAIESIGGKLTEGKYKGYDTKVLNQWRIDQFPTMVRPDGKLKDGALFSHAINFHLSFDSIMVWLEKSGNMELYRPDTIMKKYSKAQKALQAEADRANETEEEKEIREANEDIDKIEAILNGLAGPLASIRKMIEADKVHVSDQRKLAEMLSDCYDAIDYKVKESVHTERQKAKADKHEEIRKAA